MVEGGQLSKNFDKEKWKCKQLKKGLNVKPKNCRWRTKEGWKGNRKSW